MKKLITFMLCTALFAVTANAATYYVDAVNGNDTGRDGLTWATAVKTIGTAEGFGTNNNIYIKGSFSQSGAWNMTINNYYGSFQGWESSPNQRPLNDNDGNGIIESWEFKYPTTFTSTNNATAINGSAAILDGFTITHKGTVSGSTAMTTLISPSGQTVQNCVFYGSNLTYSAYTNHNGGCVLKVLGTFQNNLVEKNNVTITYGNTTDIKMVPILDINFPSSGTISAKVSGCIFRNNNASITNSTLAAAPANIRGMILNVTQTTISGSATVTFSDCIVHNNTASYTGNGSYLTATSASIVGGLSFSSSNSTDAMMNCLFANNTTTNMSVGCYFVTSSGTGVYHKVYNNVFWNNNQNNGSSNRSIQSQGTQNASTVFDNNYLDLGNGGTWTSGWGSYNVTTLSQSNTGANSPLFKNPPIKASANFIGSALATSDSTYIKQADWRITASTSYLYHVGAATGTTGISTDKAGLAFISANPSVGAYEIVTTQAITFSPFNPTNTYGDATFSLAASGGPSGNAVTFSSSDATVASVSGSTVTILKPGSCNLRADQAAGGSFSAATQASQSLTVSTKSLTALSSPTANKVYDGTNTASISGTFTGKVGSDAVTLTGTFADANVGTAKAVTATSTLGGAQAANYTYTGTVPTGLTANITAISQTINSPGTTIGNSALLPGTDITVNSGALLTVDNTSTTVHAITVNAGAKLTLTGAALTLGSLNLLSDPTLGTGTFVDQNTNGGLNVTGTSTVNQSLQAASALRTWYITPPVASATPTPALTIIKYFDETINTGAATDNWVTATTMLAQKGYQVVPVSGNDISFTGTLNNGNQNIALSSRTGTANYAGFNLIGNPYPSYLDWSLVTANSGNLALMRTTTMWYRTKSAGVYSFWTVNGDGVSAPNGASSKIPPMQAFWVRANAGGGTLALTNAMRTHAPASDLLLKSPTAKNNTAKTLVRLQVSNGTNTDEAVLYVSGNASNGMDTYDAPKMSNNNVAIPEIYTTVGTEQLVINAMNTLPLDTPIGLGFLAGNASSFSLTANQISNLPAGVKVILKDNVTSTETDLTDGISTYQFSPLQSSSDRFSVIFRSSGAVSNVETPQDNSLIVYNNAPQQLTVICNDKIQVGSTLSVYNEIGQKLLSQPLTSTSTQITGKFNPGVYMLKVNNTTKKVIIN